MALIDSDKFITHLVWSGLVDKATCGELKKAIELCTVKDIYTKDDMVAMLTGIQVGIGEDINLYNHQEGYETKWSEGADWCIDYIQAHINALKGDRKLLENIEQERRTMMGAPVHSQFAYFMRFAEYMPFLSKAYDHCKFLGIDFEEHIAEFFKDKNGKKVQETSEKESITGVPINTERAINIIENMEYVGAEPKDWDIDYSIQLGFYGGGKSISEATAYARRRELYLELYNDYINR